MLLAREQTRINVSPVLIASKLSFQSEENTDVGVETHKRKMQQREISSSGCRECKKAEMLKARFQELQKDMESLGRKVPNISALESIIYRSNAGVRIRPSC